MDYKVAYTVCDKGRMISDILKSLGSLNQFIPKRNIIVYYTPPRTNKSYEELSQYAIVETRENITKPFIFRPEKLPAHYGESVHACELKCPNVILLDCDTIIKKDITELLKRNFDVFGRIGSGYKNIDRKKYAELFIKYKKAKIVPMLNKGFVIFKNNTLNKIGYEWKKIINEDFENPFKIRFPKEQIALAISLSGYDVHYMDSRHHSFNWMGEKYVDCYVLHKGNLRGIKSDLKVIKRKMGGG